MAMLRYGAATAAQPSINVDQWFNKVYTAACKDGKCRMKTAKSVIAQYDPQKYLLSHCSIIAAVDVDESPTSESKYKDYLIKPEFSKFVNNNGDAWTKAMIQACYKTFVGANNYLEHVQIPELSKGKVIDAALREIPLGKNKAGEDLSTYYVDILVATNRKHGDLVRKIEAGEMDTLSMGCRISFSICTKCGNKAVDESEACRHVRWEKNNTFYDPNGVQRKVAELCGHASDPESVVFVDASWVKQPAFTGAVRRNTVEVPMDIQAKIEDAYKTKGYEKKMGDFLKAAAHLITAQPEKDEETPEEGPVPDETPAEEEPIEEPSSPEPETPEEEPTPEETPEEAAPPPEEEDIEFDQNDIRKWKTRVKKRLLEELGEEMTKEITEKERPGELETLDESLIKPASLVLKKVWGAKKTWDRFLKQTAGNLNKKQFNKLRWGTHMALTSNNLADLAEYGFSKRDFLAVMAYLDSHFKKPLPLQIKKAVAKLGGTRGKGPVELLSRVVSDIGRKVSREEAERSLIWLKLLDSYRD